MHAQAKTLIYSREEFNKPPEWKHYKCELCMWNRLRFFSVKFSSFGFTWCLNLQGPKKKQLWSSIWKAERSSLRPVMRTVTWSAMGWNWQVLLGYGPRWNIILMALSTTLLRFFFSTSWESGSTQFNRWISDLQKCGRL